MSAKREFSIRIRVVILRWESEKAIIDRVSCFSSTSDSEVRVEVRDFIERVGLWRSLEKVCYIDLWLQYFENTNRAYQSKDFAFYQRYE